MSKDIQISVVLGTARPQNQSRKVARYLEQLLTDRDGVQVTFVDVAEHVTVPYTSRVPKGEGYKAGSWGAIAERTDAFIFVLPEYNRSYPGEWKLLMDMLYKESYIYKVAGLVGISTGIFGGVRVTEHASQSLISRGMYILKDMLYITNVEETFVHEGEPLLEKTKEEIQVFLNLLTATAKKMAVLNK